MYPAGYWPADEGQGVRLGDYSGNGNHGQIYNIDWIGGLLDFTGVYQWIEIPATEHYTGDVLVSAVGYIAVEAMTRSAYILLAMHTAIAVLL